MNDTQEPTTAQKNKWTVEALEIIGFEEMPAPGILAKKHKQDEKILVDMNEKQPVAIFMIAGKRVAEDDEHGTLLIINQIIVDAETGKMPTTSTPDEVVYVPKKGDVPPPESNEPEVFDPPEPAQNIAKEVAEQALKTVKDVGDKLLTENLPAEIIKPSTLSTQQDLSVATIIKYINPKATEEEAYVFLQLCRARGLNPFLKEAHLIKYSHTSPASMVVGKDAFTRKAEEHKQFDGFEAGIIVRVAEDTPVEERVGAFVEKDETLLGGWAKVHRKDHKHPSICKVSMTEYFKPGRNGKKNNWDNIPATMIRKVALVQALREAFPSELSGMYDQSEMGVDVTT